MNVIEDPEERAVAIGAAWELAQKLLIVSARLEWEARTVAGDFQGDGIVTRKRTFQKFFAQDELRAWIQSTTRRLCVAAAPGVFYVFRHTADEQSFLAARLTQPRRLPQARLSDELFHEHRDILQPLMAFVSERGRLPRDVELEPAAPIREVFGGIPRAFSLIRRVTGSDGWEAIRRQRRDDLLVYLALAAFRTRPKLRQLPDALRYDIRAFFGTYKAACSDANRLLYSSGDQNAVSRACADAPVGKLLPDALYIHHSALFHLPPLLRVYEGCGRQLAGTIQSMTLIKLARHRPRVSYLVYPDFDRVGHPALTEAYVADLSRLDLHRRDYRHSPNPPILHRKELLVPKTHPFRARFARLTAREEKLGLFDTTKPIGTHRQWLSNLSARGLSLRGHQLLPTHPRS